MGISCVASRHCVNMRGGALRAPPRVAAAGVASCCRNRACGFPCRAEPAAARSGAPKTARPRQCCQVPLQALSNFDRGDSMFQAANIPNRPAHFDRGDSMFQAANIANRPAHFDNVAKCLSRHLAGNPLDPPPPRAPAARPYARPCVCPMCAHRFPEAVGTHRAHTGGAHGCAPRLCGTCMSPGGRHSDVFLCPFSSESSGY